MKLSKLIYAGHSAVFLEATEADARYVLAIDPWLMGNPLCPESLQEPAALDLIVLTHGHEDHAGDVVRLAKRYGCKVIAAFELANLLVKAGVPEDNVIPAGKGGKVALGNGISISLTNAFHSSSYELDGVAHYAGEPCGIVVSDGTSTVYHAGDTCLFNDMTLIGEMHQPTHALLPIGDHFTMGPRAAARAAKLLAAHKVIPIHHSTFGLLTGTPTEFKDWCARERVDSEIVELKPGAELTL